MLPKIKKFRINKLFGYKNVNIDFDSGVMILVGENGVGKTTILNVLYYTLSTKFEKLIDIDFHSIELFFNSGNHIVISKEDLVSVEPFNKLNPNEITINNNKIVFSANEYSKNYLTEVKNTKKSTQISFNLDKLFEDINERNQRIEKQKSMILSEFNMNIIFLPTYRRVEEDLHKLGIENYKSEFIQFGMADVEKAILTITQQIKDSAIQWYSKINGEMLAELVTGIKVTPEMRNSIQTDTLKIVLDRVGDNISDELKQSIDILLENERLFNGEYDPLIYFLSNLIKVYQKQRKYDERIQQFVKVCNNYLRNKLTYDESKVEILFKQHGKDIKLTNLSSGEKQIVSLFSKIYLDSNKDFIILFDEPELSLSIDWQQKLLPDIIGSSRCKFMFVVTHSPFIFDNELDNDARSLSSYISEE
ncbi:hypothetical protein BBR47_35880 [Brevibacillus brevis NBRC 100599]|uniref:Endonuclease GajA/Old nuclease/RecF-like AAA domain-containing protein n=1 Tax=Brevibacillus brevis (strain 47 / JCM 6285 / NBRC 100599) TaxID=358681 RepID=C0ZFK6_BREBN|nr:AAA family ATPase [Brevibacillus brevis]BAH44565.1 hypothetical protein BBR47_35880 [Brevibacillus brevis NBRC 100599]